MVATEYGSILLSVRMLFSWLLGCTNLGGRDEAENKRIVLFLAKGLCVVKASLASASMQSADCVKCSSFSICFWPEVVASISSWL